MTTAQIVLLALQASIWLIVFALGLKTSLRELLLVERQPWLLARSFVAMGVIMPAVAVSLVLAMSLPHAVAVALVALSLSPVPPVLPAKQGKAGGNEAYAVSLLATAAVLSILVVPVIAWIIDAFFAATLAVQPLPLARLLFVMLIVPLLAGMLVRRLAPDFAGRAAAILAPAGHVLLLVAAIPVLIAVWRPMLALIQDGTLVAFMAFILVGLAAGHLFGGPDAANRTILSMASASRHPGVAIAIARANFPDEKAVAPAVLLYLITASILVIPYVAWRKRVAMRAAGNPAN